jgi:hypothetical protein
MLRSEEEANIQGAYPSAAMMKKDADGHTKRGMAERVGFEPTVPYGTTVFETARFGRSRTSPRGKFLIYFG